MAALSNVPTAALSNVPTAALSNVPTNIYRCPGFNVAFVFEEVEAFTASGTQWTEIVRAIDRSTVPPVYDLKAAAYLNKIPIEESNRFQGLPHSLLYRGFFSVRSNETILDLKKRVLKEIRHSSKARRWWRRHMGNPIPLYSRSTPQQTIINEQGNEELILKGHEDQNIGSADAIQDYTYEISDNSTNNLQSFGKKISNIILQPPRTNMQQQSLLNFEVKMNEIEDMIPRPEEPDLSDLESTSYIYSDYQEEVNETPHQIAKKKKKKRRFKRRNKTITNNNYYNPTLHDRRTPRIQPEDFTCYAYTDNAQIQPDNSYNAGQVVAHNKKKDNKMRKQMKEEINKEELKEDKK
ncbi:MAG: hypothetical protein EZS28_025409 [Streblomastix strix]|uniref:Uncharacterized protein n=1 Tax=Streblomastix strix TaxID=222440 RepID=A0A5J4V989_9EUKA|nr:MAG: hypothetical protein EZS28_025409 [Streblomastix strix]